MGLLPVLMPAGVNSVVGTSWKCPDATGKEFAEELLAALLERAATAGLASGLVLFDIARAVQNAPLAVRKTRPAPYFLALFVVYGKWKCSIIDQ